MFIITDTDGGIRGVGDCYGCVVGVNFVLCLVREDDGSLGFLLEGNGGVLADGDAGGGRGGGDCFGFEGLRGRGGLGVEGVGDDFGPGA